MSGRARILVTLLVTVLWAFWLLPLTVAGVLNLWEFVVAVILTVAAIVAVWAPRLRNAH